MAVVVLICPHCESKAGMRIIGQSVHPEAAREKYNGAKVSVGLICPGCNLPVGALLKKDGGPIDVNVWSSLVDRAFKGNDSITEHGFSLVDSWPKPPAPSIPEHLPEPVAKAFLQAENNFPKPGHEEAAGSMYRRSLEVGLSIKYPEMKGTLAANIKQLVAERVLTEDIGQWANNIRLVGNDAAHADEVTREDLTMARGFADAVLKYVFTLPEQVRLREAAKN